MEQNSGTWNEISGRNKGIKKHELNKDEDFRKQSTLKFINNIRNNPTATHLHKSLYAIWSSHNLPMIYMSKCYYVANDTYSVILIPFSLLEFKV